METKRCFGCMKLKTQSPVCEHCGYDENSKNASHQLPVGTVLREQYQIGRVLGQGGFGITYLGWDLYLDIPVAIKEYYPNGMVMRETSITNDVVSCSGDVGARFRNNKERFLREAKMLARFSQVPEIVQVKNFFLANNTAYIVMEYLEGITLKQYVKDQGGRLTVERTMEILETMVKTLCKVHKAGLVHRDISPDNIMMLPSGQAKLLDFGAVRDVGTESMTKSSEAILKQGYAPIEQYQKRGSLGPWTDVYAMCATIYFCITGRVPPDAPERLLTDERLHLEETDLTPSQQKALDHGMALRLEERTPSMDALYEELFQGREEENGDDIAEDEDDVVIPDIIQDDTDDTDEIHNDQYNGGNRHTGKSRLGIRIAIGAVAAAVVCGGIALAIAGSRTGTPEIPPEAGIQYAEHGGTFGDGFSWALGQGVLEIQGEGAMESYTDQERIPGKTQYPPWYPFRDEIRAVKIGEGITTVGSYAFYDCAELETVSLPSTLRTLEYESFSNTGLRTLELPEKLERIEQCAFENTGLQSVVIPQSVSLLSSAFQGCKELTEVTLLGNTAITLDTWSGTAFTHYGEKLPEKFVLRGLSGSVAEAYAKEMGIPFEASGTAAWDDQGSLGNGLQWHYSRNGNFLLIDGEGAMEDYGAPGSGREPPYRQYAEGIHNVMLADGVRRVGAHAFQGIAGIDVHFGASLEEIGEYAFADSNLDEVVLPDTVKLVGQSAFSGCGNLWGIYIGPDTQLAPGSYTVLTSQEAPYVSLNCVVYTVEGSPAMEMAAENGLGYHLGETWLVPWISGVSKEVSPAAKPISGTCGQGLTWEMDRKAGSLKISGSGDMTDYCNRWDAGNDQNREAPPWSALSREIRSVTLGDSVRKIGQKAFFDCEALETVHFGKGLKCIGMQAFQNTGLRELILPDSLDVVEPWAFSSCQNLTRVEIPGDHVYLCHAFQNCRNLESLTCSVGVTFSMDTWYDTFLVPLEWTGKSDKLVIRGPEASSAQVYAELLDVPFEVTKSGTWEASGSCGQNLRWYLDKDTGTLFVDGVGDMIDFGSGSEAPWSAFRGQFQQLAIGNAVLSIGAHAFEGCTIRDVHMGKNLQYIGAFAFANTNIDEAALPMGLRTLGQSAFTGCRRLNSVNMGPECVPEPGDHTPFTGPGYPRPNEFMRIFTVPGAPGDKLAEDLGLEAVYSDLGMT